VIFFKFSFILALAPGQGGPRGAKGKKNQGWPMGENKNKQIKYKL
jgi:hypothetical protein